MPNLPHASAKFLVVAAAGKLLSTGDQYGSRCPGGPRGPRMWLGLWCNSVESSAMLSDPPQIHLACYRN